MNLSGKVAVVTGASRGLGQRVAIRLANQGAPVALLARGEAALRETQRMLPAGASSLVVPVDLAKPESIDDAKRIVERELGVARILVNAAGVFGPIDLVRNSDPDAWIETIQINAIAPYLACRAFVSGMIAQGWGRIVNVSSAAALHTPGPLNSAYATSKAALNHFTRHLAAELVGTGVTVNAIHPGDVKTEMWADIKAKSARLGRAAAGFTQWVDWVEQTGGDDPEKAADLVADLMTDQAASINGRFLWIKDGLQSPIPSWDQAGELQPWRR